MVKETQADAFFWFGVQTFPLAGFQASVHPPGKVTGETQTSLRAWRLGTSTPGTSSLATSFLGLFSVRYIAPPTD